MLADAVARHHLDPHAVALLDVSQLLLAAAERDGIHPAGPCARELAAASALVPRVIGTLRTELDAITADVVAELSPRCRQ